MKKLGSLIIFEGPDGVGKTTLAKELVSHLHSLNINCTYLSFPGKEEGTLGKLVYDFHHDPKSFGITKVNQTSLQVLHIAAHIDSIEGLIKPYLSGGITVVLDRYWWSTWVYGLANGVEKEILKSMIDLELLGWNTLVPDVLYLIQRETPYREELSIAKWENVISLYNQIVIDGSTLYPIERIFNDKPVARVLSKILASLEALGVLLDKKAGKSKSSLAKNRSAFKTPLQGSFEAFEEKEHSGKHLNISAFCSRLSPAKPTKVFETFWRFAAERQNIFFRRSSNEQPPWTEDKVLEKYKFTNAYRASDRVSQYLIKDVIYNGDWSDSDTVFRILLFRLFNKIETWETLTKEFGTLNYADYSYKRFDSILMKAMRSGSPIFSAAYIMPSRAKGLHYKRKHRNILRLIEMMMEDGLPLKLSESESMEHAFELLKSYPLIGDFLAFQLVTDINYSEVLNFSEMQFVIPGPGAIDGIRKCFSDLGGINEMDLIRMVTERQDEFFNMLDIQFKSLWGRRLQLVDCQNLFCEISKYARIAHPDIQGNSNRKRIKQIFKPNLNRINYWYPPKWGINEAIAKGIPTDHD